MYRLAVSCVPQPPLVPPPLSMGTLKDYLYCFSEGCYDKEFKKPVNIIHQQNSKEMHFNQCRYTVIKELCSFKYTLTFDFLHLHKLGHKIRCF